MPNYCTNVFTVTGTADDVSYIKNLTIIEGDDGESLIDFNKANPIRKEVYNPNYTGEYVDMTKVGDIDLPNITLKQAIDMVVDNNKNITASWAQDRHWSMKLSDIISEFESKNLQFDDIDKHLFIETLRCIKNYAVKIKYEMDMCDFAHGYWGVRHQTSAITPIVDDPNHFACSFDTAWRPPTPWFESLVSKSPIDVSLSLEYGEPGMWFGGEYIKTEGDDSVGHNEFDDGQIGEFCFGDSNYMQNVEWESAYEDLDITDFSDEPDIKKALEELEEFSDIFFIEDGAEQMQARLELSEKTRSTSIC